MLRPLLPGRLLQPTGHRATADRRDHSERRAGRRPLGCGALREARSAYERSLELRPINWRTWRQYALTLAKLGDLDAALDALQRVIALNPGDAAAFYSMSGILEAQGRHLEMFRVLEQGATNLLDLKLRLVAAYLGPGNPQFRDTSKAMADAVEAVKSHGDNPRSHLHLALAMLFVDGASDETSDITAVIEAARTKGGDPACCHALALLHSLRRGDRAKAEQLRPRFEQALQEPSNEPLRGMLTYMVRSATTRKHRKQ